MYCMYVLTSVSFKLRQGTHAETYFGGFRLMLKRSEDLSEPQTHLPPDADTKVMKAFHGTLIVFGEAQPKPKLWPLECSLPSSFSVTFPVF